MSDPRKIEYLALEELEADPRNPKSHDLETIDHSIGRFGVLDPIVRDGRTGYIISGHGRKTALEAMEARGETPPEGVMVSKDGSWLVPVATGWSSRTDMEASAALIALNRTTELGGWVDDALLELLDGLSEMEEGLVGVGFDEDSIIELAEKVHTLSDEEAFREFLETGEVVTTFSQSGVADSQQESENNLSSIVLVLPLEERSRLVKWFESLRVAHGKDTLAEGVLAYAEEAGHLE